ncbi:MAG: hypothetical protein KGI27_00525 [Thaumarchaeota archaeon]|nr:hypothetical protein [Nitrososphaerota archaeon]
MKTLFFLFFIGLIVTPLLPLASAHGVCTGMQPRFGRLDDVHFSSRSVQSGETTTITGNIVSLVQRDLQGYLAILSNSSSYAKWVIVSAEPTESLFDIKQNSKVPFSITVKALQPGTYRLSPGIYSLGTGLIFSMLNGCNTEPVVIVTGKPICNQGLVSILKAEDGSPACVKPDTAQILVQRGWAILPSAYHGPAWKSFVARMSTYGNITNGTAQPLIPPPMSPLLPSHHFNYTAGLYAKIPNWNQRFVCYKYPGYAIQISADISNALKFSGLITGPNGVVHDIPSAALNSTLMQIQFSASSSDPDGTYSVAFNVVNGSNTSNVNFYCTGTEMTEPRIYPSLHVPPP